MMIVIVLMIIVACVHGGSRNGFDNCDHVRCKPTNCKKGEKLMKEVTGHHCCYDCVGDHVSSFGYVGRDMHNYRVGIVKVGGYGYANIRCEPGRWLNKYVSSALECARLVQADPSCDNHFFSMGAKDGNCWCVRPNTNCEANYGNNHLPSQMVFDSACTSWKFNSIVHQIGTQGKRCERGRWLNKYTRTASECYSIVRADPSCDSNYFSWANGNDNNCWCVNPGTNCHNNLVNHDPVSTWEVRQTVESELAATATDSSSENIWRIALCSLVTVNLVFIVYLVCKRQKQNSDVLTTQLMEI